MDLYVDWMRRGLFLRGPDASLLGKCAIKSWVAAASASLPMVRPFAIGKALGLADATGHSHPLPMPRRSMNGFAQHDRCAWVRHEMQSHAAGGAPVANRDE